MRARGFSTHLARTALAVGALLASAAAHADVLLQESFSSGLGSFTAAGTVTTGTYGARMAGLLWLHRWLDPLGGLQHRGLHQPEAQLQPQLVGPGHRRGRHRRVLDQRQHLHRARIEPHASRAPPPSPCRPRRPARPPCTCASASTPAHRARPTPSPASRVDGTRTGTHDPIRWPARPRHRPLDAGLGRQRRRRVQARPRPAAASQPHAGPVVRHRALRQAVPRVLPERARFGQPGLLDHQDHGRPDRRRADPPDARTSPSRPRASAGRWASSSVSTTGSTASPSSRPRPPRTCWAW